MDLQREALKNFVHSDQNKSLIKGIAITRVTARPENLWLSLPQDRHCLLELGLHSVEGLIRQGIYPIVIHIRPKNKKRKKLRYVLVIFFFTKHRNVLTFSAEVR